MSEFVFRSRRVVDHGFDFDRVVVETRGGVNQSVAMRLNPQSVKIVRDILGIPRVVIEGCDDRVEFIAVSGGRSGAFLAALRASR